MPYKEKEIEKLFYSIGEVAKKYEVKTSLIRFWENEFEILKPKKNKKGNRLFTKEDLVNIDKIYRLVKQEGYTIAGAKNALKDKKKIINKTLLKSNNITARLESIKEKLVHLRNELK